MLTFNTGFSRWIRAWRSIGGSGMHRIRRGARIHHRNRGYLSGFAAAVVSGAIVVLRRRVPLDGRPLGAAEAEAAQPGGGLGELGVRGAWPDRGGAAVAPGVAAQEPDVL